MESFFADVAKVKAILEKVRKSLVKLQAAHEESKTVTRSETMKTLRLTMNATIEDVSVVAREAKLRLENLDVANAEAREVEQMRITNSTIAEDTAKSVEEDADAWSRRVGADVDPRLTDVTASPHASLPPGR